GTAVERHDGAVVVAVEAIVARESVHPQAAVDVAVVVDPLHGHGERRLVVSRRRVLVQVGDEVLAYQEHVVVLGALDEQAVGAVTVGAGVADVDDVVACRVAGGVDRVLVAAAAPVQGQRVAYARLVGGDGRQPIDDDDVVPARFAVDVAQHGGVADQRLGSDVEDVLLALAGDRGFGGVQAAENVDPRALVVLIAVVAADVDGRTRLHQRVDIDQHIVPAKNAGGRRRLHRDAGGDDEVLVVDIASVPGRMEALDVLDTDVLDHQRRLRDRLVSGVHGGRLDRVQGDVGAAGHHVLADRHEAGGGDANGSGREDPLVGGAGVDAVLDREHAADGQAQDVVDEETARPTAAGAALEAVDPGIDRVGVGADVLRCDQQRLGSDHVQGAVIVVVEDRAGGVEQHFGVAHRRADQDQVADVADVDRAQGVDADFVVDIPVVGGQRIEQVVDVVEYAARVEPGVVVGRDLADGQLAGVVHPQAAVGHEGLDLVEVGVQG